MSEDRGSSGQAIVAGLGIALLCLPLLIVAVPASGWVAWRLLAAVTHRPVFVHATFDQPGGLELGASLVGAFTVGIMASLLVSLLLVKSVARRAEPRVLFRTGAVALAAAAAGSWWWNSNGGAGVPVYQLMLASLAWLGALVGLRFACTVLDRAKRGHDRRAMPDRLRLGLPPLGDDGQVRPAGPWDGPRG